MNRTISVSIIFLLISCFAISCNRDKREKPDDLIPRETMVEIISEAYLIESTVHECIQDYNQKGSAIRSMYAELFDKYQISAEQFEASTNYYLSDEKTAEKFLQDCSDKLKEKQESFTGQANPVSSPQ